MDFANTQVDMHVDTHPTRPSLTIKPGAFVIHVCLMFDARLAQLTVAMTRVITEEENPLFQAFKRER